jgi:hypothetical protein
MRRSFGGGFSLSITLRGVDVEEEFLWHAASLFLRWLD